MSTLSKVQRAPLLHQSVQEALKDYIVQGGFEPGDPLPSEAELARRLGVGRSSVREAVKSLETIGILQSRRGSGVFVGHFSFEPLVESLPYGLMVDHKAMAELLDVRFTLEIGLIERAIERRTPEQLAAMHDCLARFRAMAEADQPLEGPDREFHQLLATNLDNRVLINLIDVFWRSYNRAVHRIQLVNHRPIETYLNHVAVMQAFEAGDVAATKATLDRHYDDIRDLLRRREEGHHEGT